MSAKFQTKDGDMIDAICAAYYGRTQGVVELVLEANPTISFRDPVLPAGLTITLPDVPQAKKERVRLF